jgi:hypothetical protein
MVLHADAAFDAITTIIPYDRELRSRNKSVMRRFHHVSPALWFWLTFLILKLHCFTKAHLLEWHSQFTQGHQHVSSKFQLLAWTVSVSAFN